MPDVLPPVTAAANLLEEVDGAVVEANQIALWYTGGAGYFVKTASTTISIDPYCAETLDDRWVRNLPVPFDPHAVRNCDLILSTHEHADHCDPVALVPMRDATRAAFAGPRSSVDSALGFGWPADRLRTIDHGDRLTVNDVTITAVRAYDPGARGANGYVIEAGSLVLVNMGDSLWYDEIGDQLAAWSVDAICLSVAHNPPNETYYMSEVDAVRIARDVRARILIPHHWDLWRWVSLDPRRIQAVAPWYAPDTVVRPTRFCRRLTLTRCGSGVAID